MNKYSFLIPFLALTITACSACAKKTQVEANQPNACTDAGCPVPAPAPPVTPPTPTVPDTTPDVVAQDNWQFTLIGPGWTPVTAPNPEVKALFKNLQQNLMVFLVKEPVTVDYAGYVLGTVRAMRTGGVTIAASKQASLNGDSFTMITATGSGVTIYAWLTVKNGFGYAFSCGGPTNVDAGATPCTNMAGTLTIK